jgi:hypothetical protein
LTFATLLELIAGCVCMFLDLALVSSLVNIRIAASCGRSYSADKGPMPQLVS